MTDELGPGRWQPPGPEHPERRALPGHLLAAAAALFDDLPAPLAGLVVDGAVARLNAAALPSVGEVTVDSFRVRAAAACPATATSDQPFAWTPATAARTLGLRAVAHHLRGGLAGGASPVEAAVDAVVADLIADGGDRTPGPWPVSYTHLPSPRDS